jgi:predicted dehydrogenase
MTETLDIGLVGLGYIGKLHANAYNIIPLCFKQPAVVAKLAGVLRSKLTTEETLMENLGFELRTTDPEEFYSRTYDVVDICSPNFLHLEQVRDALKHGAHVYCEKPLAMNLAEARQMVEMAEEAGSKTHVAFVFRYLPALRQMKALLEAGEIGEVFHFRGQLLHGSYVDPARPMSWRLRKAQSGGGAFADLGAHLIDMVHYLMGDVFSVRAEMRTYIEQRAAPSGAKTFETVDVDDWTLCTLHTKSGATGVIEAARMASGTPLVTSLELYGSKGSLIYHDSDPDHVRYFKVKTGRWSQGALDITPKGERPISTIWPSGKLSQGTMTNAHLTAIYDFLWNIIEDRPSNVDFKAGLAVQEVLEAGYRSAEHGGELIKLPLA